MSKKIVAVTVDQQGNVHTDFSGFFNRACEEEERRLRAVLAELGLDVQPVKVSAKSEAPQPPARFDGKQQVRHDK